MSAAIRSHSSFVLEFQLLLHSPNVLLLFCCLQSFTWSVQTVSNCVTSVPRMFHFYNQERSLTSEECSCFPARHHPAAPRHSISHWTSSTSVQRFITQQHAQDVVQFCDMSCTVCSHHERPRSPSFLSILFSRERVLLCHEFRVNQAHALISLLRRP